MKRILIVLTPATAVFLFTACRRQVPAGSPTAGTTTPEGSAPGQRSPEGELMEIEGTLKPTVEHGGWILATEEGEFLLLQLSKFRQEPWFQEGMRLKAQGRVDREVLTTFMQGTPFIVSELEPLDDSGSRTGEENHR